MVIPSTYLFNFTIWPRHKTCGSYRIKWSTHVDLAESNGVHSLSGGDSNAVAVTDVVLLIEKMNTPPTT